MGPRQLEFPPLIFTKPPRSLVADGLVLEKQMDAAGDAWTGWRTDAVSRREELVLVPDASEQADQLLLIDDGEDVYRLVARARRCGSRRGPGRVGS